MQFQWVLKAKATASKSPNALLFSIVSMAAETKRFIQSHNKILHVYRATAALAEGFGLKCKPQDSAGLSRQTLNMLWAAEG